MVALITLEEAKTLLNIPSDDEDAKLNILIPAASELVVNYLKDQADTLLGLDTGGELPTGSDVPYAIRMATALMVGILLNDPDGDPNKYFERGYLPAPVTALLYPLRDPAVA